MRTVCGLDVHKDSVFVCILNENGILFQEKFGVLTPDLERMAAALHEYDTTEVCMESTSIYWMPVWRVLEPYFSLKLVNPYFIRQLPGKKSDVKDAEWIATCLLKDLIRGSYVPEDHSRKQVSEKNSYRVLMGRITYAGLFLQQVQLQSDRRKTQEQNEGTGGYCQKDARRHLVHTSRQCRIPRLHS